MPAGLPNPVATLARCLLSLMPTEHDRPVPAATTSRICSASLIGSSESFSSAPTIGFVPAPDLDRVAEIAQQAHHLFGGFVVGVGVQRQEYRVGAFACRRAQRHPGVHTEFACRIRRAGDDLPRLGGIAVAADDDRQAREFGVPPHFDRSLELVEVDVQDPVDGHVATELARQALPLVTEGLQCFAAVGELVMHVVGIEQRQQRVGLRVEVARRSRRVEQQPDMACAAAWPGR